MVLSIFWHNTKNKNIGFPILLHKHFCFKKIPYLINNRLAAYFFMKDIIEIYWRGAIWRKWIDNLFIANPFHIHHQRQLHISGVQTQVSIR